MIYWRYKLKHESFRLFIVMAIALIAYALPVNGHAERVATAYGGDIISVDDMLVFQLSCCDARLSLAFVNFDDVSKLRRRVARREFMRDRLECTGLGRTEMRGGGPTHLVWCSRSGEGLLSKILVDRGLAKERCEISGNELGSCP